MAVISLTVLISVVAHGVTAGPLANRFPGIDQPAPRHPLKPECSYRRNHSATFSTLRADRRGGAKKKIKKKKKKKKKNFNKAHAPESAEHRGHSPPCRSQRLTVWIYDSAMGAAAGEVRLKDLKGRSALQVHDAVTVSWLPGAHQPRIGHLRRRDSSAAAAQGSVLGGLVDLIFFAPAAEAEVGPGLASLARRLRDTGIDQTIPRGDQGAAWPETSALVVLSGHGDLDEVRPSSSVAWRAATSSSCTSCSLPTRQKCCVRLCMSSESWATICSRSRVGTAQNV